MEGKQIYQVIVTGDSSAQMIEMAAQIGTQHKPFGEFFN